MGQKLGKWLSKILTLYLIIKTELKTTVSKLRNRILTWYLIIKKELKTFIRKFCLNINMKAKSQNICIHHHPI
uniref:Putative ovule protein n=1 Tax=Solanum chacoense TaxID=4108 RepID=A0A0V0GFV0_SOLCH